MFVCVDGDFYFRWLGIVNNALDEENEPKILKENDLLCGRINWFKKKFRTCKDLWSRHTCIAFRSLDLITFCILKIYDGVVINHW